MWGLTIRKKYGMRYSHVVGIASEKFSDECTDHTAAAANLQAHGGPEGRRM